VALGLVALVAVLAVVSQDQADVVRAEAAISWKEMGVPEDTPAASAQEQFIEDMENVLQDEEAAAQDEGCLIQRGEDTYHAQGKACCDDQLSKATDECSKPMKGCTMERMARSRANFNVCATAAQRGCDAERDAYKAEHIDQADVKKKQLKSMAAAASNPSELMFAALTAVTDKHDDNEAVKEESVKEEKEAVQQMPSRDASGLPTSITRDNKPVNLLTVHRRCLESRISACHARVQGAKARHLAACKGMHAAKAASCRHGAKITHDSCVAADPNAALFRNY
jgi:hypothetical protein